MHSFDMALFGKEAEQAWKLEDTSRDVIAQRIPVRNTIGYELDLTYRIDEEGDVNDIFFSANVPKHILLGKGFGLLVERIFETMTYDKHSKKEALHLSPSEHIRPGISEEHVIFRR